MLINSKWSKKFYNLKRTLGKSRNLDRYRLNKSNFLCRDFNCHEILFLFSDFVTTCFGPFSATINDVGAYDNLMRESQVYLLQLMGKLCRRRMELQPSIISSVRSKLKMTTIDLKVNLSLFRYSLILKV